MNSVSKLRPHLLLSALLCTISSALHAQSAGNVVARAQILAKIGSFSLQEHAGRIYVIEREGGDERRDGTLHVYDTNLRKIWTLEPSRIDGHTAYTAELGAHGSLLIMRRQSVTGISDLDTGEYDTTPDRGITLWKFDPTGKLSWRRDFDSLGPDITVSVVFDGDENIVLCYQRSYLADSTDRIVEKLSPEGKTLWQRTIQITSWRSIPELAVDAANRIHVIGMRDRTGAWPWLEHRTFLPDGTTGIFTTHSIRKTFETYIPEVTVDSVGNAFVALQLETEKNGWGYHFVKMTVDGRVEWSREIEFDGNPSHLVASERNGDIDLLSVYYDDAGEYNYTLRRIDPRGKNVYQFLHGSRNMNELYGSTDVDLTILRSGATQIVAVASDTARILRFDSTGAVVSRERVRIIPDDMPYGNLYSLQATPGGTIFFIVSEPPLVKDGFTYPRWSLLKYVP